MSPLNRAHGAQMSTGVCGAHVPTFFCFSRKLSTSSMLVQYLAEMGTTTLRRGCGRGEKRMGRELLYHHTLLPTTHQLWSIT